MSKRPKHKRGPDYKANRITKKFFPKFVLHKQEPEEPTHWRARKGVISL